MSASGRKKRSMKRAQEKRERHAKKAALYKSYAEEGRKNKSKRFLRKKATSNAKGQHLMTDCGNVGCQRCNPRPIVLCNGKMSNAA